MLRSHLPVGLQRVAHRLAWIGLLWLVGAMVLSACVDDPAATATPQPANTLTPSASGDSIFHAVSAAKLAEAYAANPANADVVYRGQDLAVTGTIHSVTQPFPNSALVVLTGHDNLNVGCFAGIWEKYRDLRGLVTMFGLGQGLDFSMGFTNGVVNLSHCEVIGLENPRPLGDLLRSQLRRWLALV